MSLKEGSAILDESKLHFTSRKVSYTSLPRSARPRQDKISSYPLGVIKAIIALPPFCVNIDNPKSILVEKRASHRRMR